MKFKRYGDALAPTSAPFGAVVRLPIPITVGPHGTRTVDLQLECDTALLVTCSETVAQAGLLPDHQVRVVMPGKRLTVELSNRTTAGRSLAAGDVVVYLMAAGGDSAVEVEDA